MRGRKLLGGVRGGGGGGEGGGGASKVGGLLGGGQGGGGGDGMRRVVLAKWEGEGYWVARLAPSQVRPLLSLPGSPSPSCS